jgi:hypothetical protein
MNDKWGGRWAVGRAIRTSLVLAFLFLFVSGAFATSSSVIQEMIDNASPGDYIQVPPDTYTGSIVVNQTVILEGIDNPILVNASPGSVVVNVTGDGAGSAIAGFNITGSSSGTAVLVNGPDAANVALVYNNIYRNNIGLNASDFGTCLDYEPFTLNFWGENGTGPQRGKDGASTIINSQSNVNVNNVAGNVASKVKGKTSSKVYSNAGSKAKTKANSEVSSVVHTNNGIVGFADDSAWLTAGVINGKVAEAMYNDCPSDDLVLLNPDAGVDVSIFGAIEPSAIVGSAAYLGTPYGPIPPGLGVAIRYVDVFVKGDNVDEARVDISYTPEEVADAGVFEDSLTPYLWTGTTWRSPINGTLIRDPDNGVVSGNFSTLSLSGQPIALIGRSYEVTIIPKADPTKPISTNPVLDITIDSVVNIGAVYYQLDGHASNGWKLIEDVGFASTTWQNPSWAISDADWANVTNGTHTFYFNFTRDSLPPVGGDGEISWQFTKGGNVPPVSPIVITSPKAGDTLTRALWKITWTMPSPENVLSVDLWFARDGDFTMRGGLNNPLHLATLGADTSYLWRSPNFQTDIAKIAAVVTYNDGTQFVGFSDDFSLAKGYSFHAYKPTPKTPWQLGSGLSRAVVVIGSWFKSPHIPYVIG